MEAEKLKANLQLQLDEIESLQSMFYNPGEIKIEDPLTVIEMKNYVEDVSTFIPSELDLSVNLNIDSLKFQLYINLPQEYPYVPPTIFVRNQELTRVQNGELNKNLKVFMESLEKGEPYLFSAISWVQDKAPSYVELKSEIPNIIECNSQEPPCRLWIYSHHIYSKTKRREILNQAQSLNLNGFCMPGKPGIICVEGKSSSCNEWWHYIRSLPWKRIFCKVTEEYNGEDEFIKFKKFEEVSFQTSSARCNHMDMGELSKYLEEHKCAYIFKDLFGLEAKQS